MKKIIAAVCLVLIIGCGGGGGTDGGGGTEVSTWTGPVNQYMYPDVEGEYTLEQTILHGTCSDGSTGEITFYADEIGIVQSRDSLVFYNISASGEWSPTAAQVGSVDKSGGFITYRSEKGFSVIPIYGIMNLEQWIIGRFTESGWSGTVKMEIYNSSRQGCTFNGPFMGGRKLSS